MISGLAAVTVFPIAIGKSLGIETDCPEAILNIWEEANQTRDITTLASLLAEDFVSQHFPAEEAGKVTDPVSKSEYVTAHTTFFEDANVTDFHYEILAGYTVESLGAELWKISNISINSSFKLRNAQSGEVNEIGMNRERTYMIVRKDPEGPFGYRIAKLMEDV